MQQYMEFRLHSAKWGAMSEETHVKISNTLNAFKQAGFTLDEVADKPLAYRIELSADFPDCWYWIGSQRNKRPIYFLHAQGKQVYSHRYLFERFIRPLLKGETIRHGSNCGSQSGLCVNPLHYVVVHPRVPANATD